MQNMHRNIISPAGIAASTSLLTSGTTFSESSVDSPSLSAAGSAAGAGLSSDPVY